MEDAVDMNHTYDNAATSGTLSKILSRAVPAWRSRPDSEHEQATIRFIMGSVASLFLMNLVFSKHIEPNAALLTISGIAVFYAATLGIIAWLIIRPGLSVSRRICGCIVDNYGATASLLINGDLAAPIFVVYLWVTFGNGFRYGKQYLLFSMLLNIIGFLSVLLLSNSWSTGTPVSIGLLVGLILLPLYVASLLGRLEDALDNAEVANRAKSNFLATMSHEIRTPLNGLIGLIDLLGMTRLQEKQQHYLDLMKNSSTWLMDIISDSLDFTKIEANELIIETVDTDLKSMINKISKVFHETATSKGLAFSVHADDDLPDWILCDQNRLVQVLNNLLSNACKFTNNGQVSLKVTSKPLQHETVRLFFAVEDSGIGLEKSNMDIIFSPFKQIEPTDASLHGGTGLGLAIVHRLIRLMGGDISVESTPGQGSTFSFHLDVSTTIKPQLPKEDPLKNEISWIRRPLILLVEDNFINQEVARTYLAHLGCQVRIASDGQEAVDLVPEHDFDLILMDCQMPRLDGYQAARQIRLTENDDERIPIVALTAHVTVEDRQKCLDAGMDDYMGKPYVMKNLEQLLFKWLHSMISLKNPSKPKAVADPAGNPGSPENDISTDQWMHQFRNAMGGVIGNLELALLSVDDTGQCEALMNNALTAAQVAVSTAEDLKSFRP